MTDNGQRIDIEHQVIDVFRSVRDGVSPYPVRIGDRVFVFDKRPSARLQMQVFEIFGSGDEEKEVTIEDMRAMRDLMAAMLEDKSNIDDLLDAVDLNELAEIFNKAMVKLSERPTTESSPSSPTHPAMTLPTGASEQASPTSTSTG